MTLVRPTLWMMVGLPGTGKSTWITEQMNKDKLIWASTDNYIEGVAEQIGSTYNDVWPDHVRAAEKNMNFMIDYAFSVNANIVWDQTNLSSNIRRKKLARVPKHYFKVAHYFPLPNDEEWNRRLSSRPGKIIPQGVLLSMKKSLELPSIAEGFDEILGVEKCEALLVS